MSNLFYHPFVKHFKDNAGMNSATNGEGGYYKFEIDTNGITAFLQFLRMSTFFRAAVLVDITCVDLLLHPSYSSQQPGVTKQNRFKVVYILRSLSRNSIYEVSCETNDTIPSVTSIQPSATQMEQEVHEFFGVNFTGSLSGQKRLLTDYGFTGHPLRKDFPLYGFSQVKYSQLNKTIVHEPVEFSQELN